MDRIHVPQKVVIPLSVVFRFFPTVKEEYVSIRDAMKMRGIITVRSPMKMLEYRIVPLMMSVAKIGEELRNQPDNFRWSSGIALRQIRMWKNDADTFN